MLEKPSSALIKKYQALNDSDTKARAHQKSVKDVMDLVKGTLTAPEGDNRAVLALINETPVHRMPINPGALAAEKLIPRPAPVAIKMGSVTFDNTRPVQSPITIRSPGLDAGPQAAEDRLVYLGGSDQAPARHPNGALADPGTNLIDRTKE